MDFLTFVNLIHILSAVFWGGGAWIVAWFVTPTVKATGPEGQAFLRGLTQGTKIVAIMTVSSFAAILSGLYMYWVLSGGFDMAWITSQKGLATSIGGLAAIVALLIGQTVQRPTANRIAALGKEIQEAGGPPSEEQLKEMQTLQDRITGGGKWVAILLVITIIGMALGRRLFQ